MMFWNFTLRVIFIIEIKNRLERYQVNKVSCHTAIRQDRISMVTATQKDPTCLSPQISVSLSKSASITFPEPLCNFTCYSFRSRSFVDQALFIKKKTINIPLILDFCRRNFSALVMVLLSTPGSGIRFLPRSLPKHKRLVSSKDGNEKL